jgi:hypothetical protein
MRKDVNDKIDVNPIMAKLPFEKFAKLHKMDHPNDPLTVEERYVKIGGKLPEKAKPSK